MGSGRHGHSHESHGHSHESHGHSHESHGHSHESHGHSHGHSHGKEKNFLGCCFCSDTTRLSSMLVMTSFFFLVELIVGQISKSIALTADSFHMLSDALALIIGLFTTIISKRLSNKNTFGWIRAEVLGPLINSVFLIALCLGIVIEALKRLFKPEAVEDIDLLLYVGILGLLINIAGLFLFGHGHSHSIPHAEEDDEDEDNEAFDDKEVQKPLNSASVQTNPNPKKPNKKKCCTILSKEANMNMRAVFLHVLADALGSVIVIISALLNKYQSHLHISEKIIVLIDPILCLCLVALIFSTTFPLFKESALILLQTVPKEIQVTKLKQDLVDEIPGVSAVHELHIWKLSGRKIIATAHVTCHNTAEYMQLAAEIKEFFHKRGIHSTTIQPEFTQPVEGIIAYESCMIECMKDCTENTCCGQSNLANNNKSVASQLKNLANQPNEPMTMVEASAVVVTFK